MKYRPIHLQTSFQFRRPSPGWQHTDNIDWHVYRGSLSIIHWQAARQASTSDRAIVQSSPTYPSDLLLFSHSLASSRSARSACQENCSERRSRNVQAPSRQLLRRITSFNSKYIYLPRTRPTVSPTCRSLHIGRGGRRTDHSILPRSSRYRKGHSGSGVGGEGHCIFCLVSEAKRKR